VNIDIIASETFLSEAERDYIRRRLEYGLGEHEPAIEQIQVWMVGIVAAGDDDARYCLINVKLVDGSLVACDGTDAEPQIAISRAAERVGVEVARILRRQRKKVVRIIDGLAGSYRRTPQASLSPNRL